MNSYQKLKQKILELERDLQVVCTSPEHPQALEIIDRVKMNAKWGDIVTFGSPTRVINNFEFDGLLSQIDIK